MQEILQNGRSANCLKAWILVAEGSVQARKTTKGKPSCIYCCLVSDGHNEAVLTAWGEGAKLLHETVKGREGQQLAITQVGASNRNSRVGIPELIAGRGVTVQAVAVSDEEKPLPRCTDMQRLAEVSDWSAVNIEGRVLEVGGDISSWWMRVAWQSASMSTGRRSRSCRKGKAAKCCWQPRVHATPMSQ